MEEDYWQALEALTTPSFQEIRQIATSYIKTLSVEEDDTLYQSLGRGQALLDSHAKLCKYLHAFGNMHEAKLEDALSKIPAFFWRSPFEIIDWGCGQGIATLKVIDHLRAIDQIEHIKRITLIEPSEVALLRAELHLIAAIDAPVQTLPHYFDRVSIEDIESKESRPRLHLFSNILDVPQIDLKQLATVIDQSTKAQDFFLIVSPIYTNSNRIDAFLRYFNTDYIQLHASENITGFKGKSWTYLLRLVSLTSGLSTHLRNLQWYPSVSYSAAYALDFIFNDRSLFDSFKESGITHYQTSAAFDLGAYVYEDTHPLLAALQNIVTRGIPTKASPYIEQVFSDCFKLSQRKSENGSFGYPLTISRKGINDDINNVLKANHSTDAQINQLVHSPVAIARFHKVLVEAIITGQLDMEAAAWNILAEEKDVPFAVVGLEDFKQLFEHLRLLSRDYEDFHLPQIHLTVVSNPTYCNSPLHLGHFVHQSAHTAKGLVYDMVISLSNGEIQEELNIPFPYQTKSKACFLVGRATTFKDTRSVYTTDSIYYKPLGTKSQDGSWIPDNVTTSHLRYFLQLFFRKEDFRPGQLPILDRALSNLPVIGLLPTGGGKSLTYQIAGLLQPGITMIIDPLKSLMRDQYEGLLKNGIDSTTFINSSVDTDERRRRELALESASIQFVFLSPERLAITNFRERLSEMYNRYAYFSYGVIDEVHCVSEWGHDFRFSYLHLGRNLYQHARAKSGNISLFGLTATASFDVLADVERELSGSGAFDLDQDTIVRYENATRLELQYRIERVSILFERDTYFTSPDPLWSDFPSPVKVEKHFTGYNTKQSHLVNYLQQLPRYYRTLITEEAMQVIKQRFAERQNFPMNQEISLKPKHLIDHSKQEVSYESAGIIFCPHIKNTGISVIEIARTIQTKLQLARISTFHGKLDDDKAENNLDDFSNNRSPIMVATKAFGMGIDKPNVRFTVNMNHSSSLEAFVQEAGRAGRDQKMALSTILFSDYKLVLIRRSCKSIPPHLNIIKNKWFYRGDMASIFEKYNLNVSKEDILVATPQQDAVKLYCQQDNKMFAFKECSEQCSLFKRCELKNASDNARGWMRESELIQQLEIENIALNRNYFKYLNPDFEGNMYFFNNSFKGEIFEKIYMHRLLKIIPVQYEHLPVESIGFLPTLIDLEEGHFTHVHIPYIEDADIPKNELRNTKHNSYSNLSKAIYRMTCIGLVEDFTQDYHAKKFRIGVRRKKEGAYFEALEEFLKRYFSAERAKKQLVAVKQIAVQSENNALQKEIYQCLSFLTHFVYDKISEKRKRAIDDIRNFCLDGLNAPDWLTANEQLKDYIYYYFNSKYARRDYTAQNGEPFSLIEDTDEGKIAPPEVLFKYLRIVDDSDPAVTSETPVDNIKHLLGAIRLISRSLTDSNPTLTLLEAFCIAYLNPVSNQDLLDSIERNYVAGLRDFFNRMEDQDEFWQLFHDYNSHIQTVWQDAKFESLSAGMELVLHLDKFNQIKSKYLN